MGPSSQLYGNSSSIIGSSQFISTCKCIIKIIVSIRSCPIYCLDSIRVGTTLNKHDRLRWSSTNFSCACTIGSIFSVHCTMLQIIASFAWEALRARWAHAFITVAAAAVALTLCHIEPSIEGGGSISCNSTRAHTVEGRGEVIPICESVPTRISFTSCGGSWWSLISNFTPDSLHIIGRRVTVFKIKRKNYKCNLKVYYYSRSSDVHCRLSRKVDRTDLLLLVCKKCIQL